MRFAPGALTIFLMMGLSASAFAAPDGNHQDSVGREVENIYYKVFSNTLKKYAAAGERMTDAFFLATGTVLVNYEVLPPDAQKIYNEGYKPLFDGAAKFMGPMDSKNIYHLGSAFIMEAHGQNSGPNLFRSRGEVMAFEIARYFHGLILMDGNPSTDELLKFHEEIQLSLNTVADRERLSNKLIDFGLSRATSAVEYTNLMVEKLSLAQSGMDDSAEFESYYANMKKTFNVEEAQAKEMFRSKMLLRMGQEKLSLIRLAYPNTENRSAADIVSSYVANVSARLRDVFAHSGADTPAGSPARVAENFERFKALSKKFLANFDAGQFETLAGNDSEAAKVERAVGEIKNPGEQLNKKSAEERAGEIAKDAAKETKF